MHQAASMEHFKQKQIEYPDYYSSRRIQTKRKDLPPVLHRQQVLWKLGQYTSKYDLTLWEKFNQ